VTTPLRARAVTRGQDIYFHPGEYRPGTASGDALIAHELAHTLQTRGSARGDDATEFVSEPGDALERNADALARGETAHVLAAPAGAALRTPFPGETAEQERHRLAAIAVLQRTLSTINLWLITGRLWPEEQRLPDGRIVNSYLGESETQEARDAHIQAAADNIIALIEALQSAAVPAAWAASFARFRRGPRGSRIMSAGSDRQTDPDMQAWDDAMRFYVHWSAQAGHTTEMAGAEVYYIQAINIAQEPAPPPQQPPEQPPRLHPFEGQRYPVAQIVVDDPEHAPLVYHLVTERVGRGYLADVYYDNSARGHFYIYHGRRVYLPDFHLR